MSGLDALFVGAHPDDVELASGGLAALLASHGHRVGILDVTRGERASRGNPETRAREAEQAARELGVTSRESLGLPDLGLDRSDRAQLAAMVGALRRHRPALVIAPGRDDDHPDHAEASHLVERACYLSGLVRFEAPGERFRPRRLLFAVYQGGKQPDLVVDVSPAWERRVAAIRAHASQLGGAPGPQTYLTEPDFLALVEARARHWGGLIGARFGEAYRVRGPVPVTDARLLLAGVAAGAREASR